MPSDSVLHIRQTANGTHAIRLTLRRPGQPDLEGNATIEFSLTAQEQSELRWYMEDYLQRADTVEAVTVAQIEAMMRARGEELYRLVLAANLDTQAIWFAIREHLADLRIEVTTGVAEAASIPWELMRDPQSDSPIALRVKAFVRKQSNPSLSFVGVPPLDDGRIRLLYVVCRPGGTQDVGLRAVFNRLLQELGGDLARFEITALRPPTFERLQRVLGDAKVTGRPFHIVHFDGHGIYEDLSNTTLADWLKTLSLLTLGGPHTGKHGYLLFEHPSSREQMRPVSGAELGKLLHDSGVPVLALNACQSAMNEATERPEDAADDHDAVRAIGSLAQAVIDQGIPAVLGMRYSVYVVTASQYIGQLYAALARGRTFGEAAGEGRKHLAANPDRWVGLQPRPLQDWFVPVIYEAMPIELLPPAAAAGGLELNLRPELDPVLRDPVLRRYVPDTGFIGRDETLLLLDRAFDSNPVVLLHAYAGQGKSATAVEFSRWYAMTGGLGAQPVVLLTSFEQPTDLAAALNQVGAGFAPYMKDNGIEWHAMNDPAERRDLIIRIFRQLPVLWIWDNVEPVAGFPAGSESQLTAAEQAELADFLKQVKLDRATKVKILLTSRRDEQAWLGGVPHRVAMPRMRRADAAALAVEIGRERGLSRHDVNAWGPLLDYCAGNPLTLRVIAGQAVRQGLRTQAQIAAFIQALRDGEQHIVDVDSAQGRDRSLGASLDYGFRHAFRPDELPIIALLHLFQGTVDVDTLELMGRVGDYALPELQGKTIVQLTALLDRAAEAGLLTPLTHDASRLTGYYSIHPALPWYLRQLFDQSYPFHAAQRGSSAEAALRAWVEAMGEMGNYYHRQSSEGNRGAFVFLALEEANLLHARRSGRRHGWWQRVTYAMQGLNRLYEYQGRTAEWARLVAEIVPDYCTPDDDPIPGREEEYALVMGYRVRLAWQVERNLRRATAIQVKRVAWDRRRAAAALALPPDAPLDAAQRYLIRTLAISTGTLGQILKEQRSPECVAAYQEAIQYAQRIGDTTVESTTHFQLGNAYQDLPAIRDLDAAEAAYRSGLKLANPNDALASALNIRTIGTVYHKRFIDARARGESTDALRYAQATEQHYKLALALCPPTAVADLGLMYGTLGDLYRDVGRAEQAREAYEKSIQHDDLIGDHYRSGSNRVSLAVVYLRAAHRESTPAHRRDMLQRALAYAQAGLRDYKSYNGRSVDQEGNAHRLIEDIKKELGE
ncbi:MAG: CHAT domain-containing protein [Caldilinea sp.]|nr:CHAT domain-containing protein [Caldilinea sp.]